MSTKYVGWINGRPPDLEVLKALGVKGEMKYDVVQGSFSYCEVDEETIERLRAEYEGFWPGAFTAVDDEGNQLPREQQKYWGHYA